MTNTGGYILANGIGAAISGAIGAAVAESSKSHPILKGAFVTGAISAFFATVAIATLEKPTDAGGTFIAGQAPPYPTPSGTHIQSVPIQSAGAYPGNVISPGVNGLPMRFV
jgi:hypothetical protein